MEAIQFTTPPGRLVAGNLYKSRDKDHQGNPLLIKSGPNMGKPRVDFFFAVAITKTPGQHWAASDWGSKIWQAGHQFMANAGQLGDNFAWKIIDGDSTVPNEAGRKPCDQEGYAGCWVLRFGGGFAPKIARALSGAPEWDNTPDLIKLGDYVQVAGSVAGNGASGRQAGVYLNHGAVCLVGYGKRISTGIDLAQAGFGGAPLPPGASTTPVAVGFGQPQVPGAPTVAAPPVGYPAPAASPAAPVPPSTIAPSPAAPVVLPPSIPGTPTSPSSPLPPIPGTVPPPGVVPNLAFLQVPGAPGAVPGVPAVPMAPPVAPVRQMTAKATGFTYEQLVSQGWTDALLVQHGMMTA